MKVILSTIALITTILLSCIPSSAQITLTEENIPKVGTNYIKGVDDLPIGIDAGEPGTGYQIWDFTTLLPDDTIGYSYLDPLATPFPLQFPESNLALHNADTAYSYLHYDQDIYELEGIMAEHEGEEYVFDYIPDMTILNFPFTYGDAFSQDYFFEYVFGGTGDSVRIKNHVSKWVEADAWGSVVLPSGTFDALRLSVIQQSKDSTWAQVGSNWLLISTTNSTTNFYDWYTNAPGVDLLLVSLIYDQNWTILESANFFMGSYVGLTEGSADVSIHIYPNPSEDEIFLQMEGMENATLQIVDISGRVVMEEAIHGEQQKFSVKDIQSGTYVCRILDDDHKGIFTKKIIIRR